MQAINAKVTLIAKRVESKLIINQSNLLCHRTCRRSPRL
ncbi:Putative uncharacterized protein [Moritella viscosa]|nr:Putative uncharacterized protein [Moritella viscosa]